MQLSIPGLLVCLLLFLVGYVLRGRPLIISLFASFAFGTTAIVNLPALGGASPLIYVVFAILILIVTAFKKGAVRDLGTVFAVHRTSFVVLALLLYVCASAILLPRLFLGETSVFITRSGGASGVLEVPLAPTASNISQSGYFALGALMYFATAILLTRYEAFELLRKGFVIWACFHAGLGLINFVGTTVGAGDVLLPLRTANYAMLTQVEHAGFSRVVGGYPEASSFGSATFGCLAFTYASWKVNKSPLMAALSAILLMLLLMSTSTTAYLALGIALVPLVLSVAYSLGIGKLTKPDVYVLAAAGLIVVLTLCMYVYNSRTFDPIFRLIDETLVSKFESDSAKGRAYWNAVCFQAFLDTNLLGVGMGSSRASSWLIAVISQIGLPGALLYALLIWQLVRDPVVQDAAGLPIQALYRGARASALCTILAAAVSGGSADPGIGVFMALAVVLSCRRRLLARDQGRLHRPTIQEQGGWVVARP